MQIGYRKEIRKLTFRALALRRSDEGLTLETSASECLYGGQFTLSSQLIKPNDLVILPPTQHHSFFRNLPPLFEMQIESWAIVRSIDARLRVIYTCSLIYRENKRVKIKNKKRERKNGCSFNSFNPTITPEQPCTCKI